MNLASDHMFELNHKIFFPPYFNLARLQIVESLPDNQVGAYIRIIVQLT